MKYARNWEFLPPQLFYPPLALYILWLCIRFWRPPWFIAKANPGMPLGGLIMSKFGSLESCKEPVKSSYTARQHLVVPKEKGAFASAKKFVTTYPIIAKPDHGQRGTGVQLIQTEEELEQLCSNAAVSYILQDYYDFPYEFGVYYVHVPGKEPKIFSITQKLLLRVKGDGTKTFGDLIRELNTHPKRIEQLLEKHKGSLQEVVPNGQERKTVISGSHCKGAEFRDANVLITPELTALFSKISSAFPGFFIGRYDVKSSTPDMTGEIRIVEINGVDAESTNIYDQQHSIWSAYSILARQWKYLFIIAKKNERLSPSYGMLQMIKKYRRFFADLSISNETRFGQS